MMAAVEISESVQQALDDLVGFLPNLLGFLIVLLVGYIVAKVLQKVVALALEKAGTDRAVREGSSGEMVNRLVPDISPSALIGRLIFIVATAVAGLLARVIARTMGDSPSGKLAATAVPALVMAIAVFMILNQLQIATTIVTITYAAVMGAIALGMALAFGLGGRDVASRLLEDAYRKGQVERQRLRAQRPADGQARVEPTGRPSSA